MDEVTRLGGQIVPLDPYLGDRPSVSPYIERLGKNPADFIVVAGYRSEAEEILRQARSHGINVPIMGGDGLEQIEQSGVLAEGVYLTAAYSPEIATPGNRRFVEAYTRRFPGGASPNQSAVGTYDALYLLGPDHGRTRGQSPADWRIALAKVGNEAPPYAGLTRAIAFDSAGDLADQRVLVGLVARGRSCPRKPNEIDSLTILIAVDRSGRLRPGRSADPDRVGWRSRWNDSTVAPSLHTAQMAIDEINAAGGIHGRPLELIVIEDAGETDSAVRVAAQLVDSGVVAVIGHIYSSTTLAAAPVTTIRGTRCSRSLPRPPRPQFHWPAIIPSGSAPATCSMVRPWPGLLSGSLHLRRGAVLASER